MQSITHTIDIQLYITRNVGTTGHRKQPHTIPRNVTNLNFWLHQLKLLGWRRAGNLYRVGGLREGWRESQLACLDHQLDDVHDPHLLEVREVREQVRLGSVGVAAIGCLAQQRHLPTVVVDAKADDAAIVVEADGVVLDRGACLQHQLRADEVHPAAKREDLARARQISQHSPSVWGEAFARNLKSIQ